MMPNAGHYERSLLITLLMRIFMPRRDVATQNQIQLSSKGIVGTNSADFMDPVLRSPPMAIFIYTRSKSFQSVLAH